MKRLYTAIACLALLFFVGCTPTQPADNQSTQQPVFDNVTINETENTTRPIRTLNGSVEYRLEATEGDVLRVPLTAVDPDGDTVTYEYEEPFDENGVWQTEIGDAGRYVIDVVASDGRAETVAPLVVTINKANRAPVLNCPDQFVFSEGELANLQCDVFDEEGDEVVVSYSGWSRSRTKRTSYLDSGEYTVRITASDGNSSTSEEVPVIIEDTNRPPSIEGPRNITVEETSTVTPSLTIEDPDGDDVTVTYTEPLNEDGIWETTFGDAGTYTAAVTASDGDLSTTRDITITVQDRNQAPVIRPLDLIRVNEGETVQIEPETYDPDGDSVSISFSGWMSSSTKQTSYTDAHPSGCTEKGCTARYSVFVTATDGQQTSQDEVVVEVVDTNRTTRFVE